MKAGALTNTVGLVVFSKSGNDTPVAKLRKSEQARVPPTSGPTPNHGEAAATAVQPNEISLARREANAGLEE
jgi:hypothetical protein